MSVRPSRRWVSPRTCSGAMYGKGSRDLAPAQLLDLLVDGQAEVADVRLAPEIEQDIRGFQVAVDDAGRVGVVHGVGDEGHDPGQAENRHGAGSE